MARARNIKPGFYKNEDLAECSVWARYIFPGLWMLADREGRLEDRPKRIKGELLPFDGQDVNALLNELASRKDAQGVPFIVRYQNADGSFIQISKFSTHQSPHYSEKPSTIKGPELREYGGDDEHKKPGTLPEDSQKQPIIKRGSQPPDSLNPDSLNPESLKETTPATVTKNTGHWTPAAGAPPLEGKPDPKVVAHVDALRVGIPAGTNAYETAAMLWATLHANGCKGTAAHPAVIEMARQGVTVDALKRAITEARKTQDGQINPAYIAAILDRIRTEKPSNGKTQAWATDDSATEAKARELGLWPAKPGEDYHALRTRIRASIERQAQAKVQHPTELGEAPQQVPKPAAQSLEKATQAIQEARQAAQTASPMPEAIRTQLKRP